MGEQAYLCRGGEDDPNRGIGDGGEIAVREPDEFKDPGASFLLSLRFGEVFTKGKHNLETDLGDLAGEPLPPST